MKNHHRKPHCHAATEPAWDKRLHRWFHPADNRVLYYRLRGRLARIDEDLKQHRRRSPNSWAVCAGTCASALWRFALYPDTEKWAELIQCSPARLLRMMAACAVKAKCGALAYREQNINPQAAVTVNPYLKQCRAALEAWRKRCQAIAPQPVTREPCPTTANPAPKNC